MRKFGEKLTGSMAEQAQTDAERGEFLDFIASNSKAGDLIPESDPTRPSLKAWLR
jgi:hypothetical protein